MKLFWGSLVVGLGAFGLASYSANAEQGDKKVDTRVFELRTYYAAPGKMKALHERFRNHTVKLFEKHGMKNIGYWVPTDNPENKLVYILSFADRAARDKAFKEFGA